MLTFLCGVIILQLSGVVSIAVARDAFALGTLLFVGQVLGLAGHYQLFNRTGTRKFVWFPGGEKVVVSITAAASVAYLVVVLSR